DVFDLAEEGPALWFVLHADGAVQFLQQLLLSFGQARWGLHLGFHEQVTLAMPVQHRHTLAADAKYRSRLGAFGDFKRVLAIQRRNLNFSSERSLGERDGDDAVQVVALPL